MLTILQGDVIEQLRRLPDESVHCCVTSPPYWGLRDYGTAQWEGGIKHCDHVERNARQDAESRALLDGSTRTGASVIQFANLCGKCGAKRIDSQLGLEKTPEEYVAKMVEVFREVRRVLRKDGTLWLNLGDSYWGGGNGPSGNFGNPDETRPNNSKGKTYPKHQSLKPKDLCGIPWRVAFALQADGWWLRSDIIWAKPNPMPESVTDRPTKGHEYLFLLTKSANYFYDAVAIMEPQNYPERRYNSDTSSQKCSKIGLRLQGGLHDGREQYGNGATRNKRSVWTVATAPYPEAHFATYPPDLIKPCILAGTSAKGCCAKCGSPWERVVESSKSFKSGSGRAGNLPNGKQDLRASETNSTPDIRLGPVVSTKTIGWQPTCKCDIGIEPCRVLDCFGGSGTTGMVALDLGRKAILIELNPKYVELIKTRCNITPGLQLA